MMKIYKNRLFISDSKDILSSVWRIKAILFSGYVTLQMKIRRNTTTVKSHRHVTPVILHIRTTWLKAIGLIFKKRSNKYNLHQNFILR